MPAQTSAPTRLTAPPGLTFSEPIEVPDDLSGLTEDPTPADFAGDEQTPGGGGRKWPVLPKAGGVGPKNKRDRLSAELQAYAILVTAPVMLRDETCGQALADVVDPFCDQLARILSRYPDLADKFTQSGVFLDCIKLLHILWPVMLTVRDHHSRRPDEMSNDDHGATGRVDFNAYPAYSPATARP